jgi:hypothetical protein
MRRGLEVGNLLAQSGMEKCVRAGTRFLGYFGQLGRFLGLFGCHKAIYRRKNRAICA